MCLTSSSSVRIKISLQRVVGQFGPTSRTASLTGSSLDQSSPEAQRTRTDDGVNGIQMPTHSAAAFMTPETQQNGGENSSSLSPPSMNLLEKARKAAQLPLGCDDPEISLCQIIRQMVQFASLTFHVHRAVRCNGSCTCVCHYPSRLQSPRFLDRFFGSLFIGYVGLPVWTRTCDQNGCFNQYSRTLQISYAFPQRLLSRTVDFAATMTYTGDPSFGLIVRNRVRIGENSVFTRARVGDTAGIWEAFNNREASITDLVYGSGQTILQVALELGHIETCQFLMSLGLNPYIIDDRRTSAAMEISLRILQNQNFRRGPEMENALPILPVLTQRSGISPTSIR